MHEKFTFDQRVRGSALQWQCPLRARDSNGPEKLANRTISTRSVQTFLPGHWIRLFLKLESNQSYKICNRIQIDPIFQPLFSFFAASNKLLMAKNLLTNFFVNSHVRVMLWEDIFVASGCIGATVNVVKIL